MLLECMLIWDEILHEFRSRNFFTVEFPVLGDVIATHADIQMDL